MSSATSPVVSTSNSILATLRAHTADLHRQLDERVEQRPILTEAGYLRFLNMHARVLPAAETWLARRGEFCDMPNAGARLRSRELERDLQLLGASMPEIRNMSFLNENTSVAGMCYVLEGSRLGGAFLTSLIERNGNKFPVNFLSQGQEMPLWKTFVAWLSTREHSASRIESATNAAVSVFGAYLAALD
jgi:heme oxygenase (biliverdin-IX-beta and delta-forming)